MGKRGVSGIPLDRFQSEIEAALNEYGIGVQKIVSEAAEEAAKQTVKQLRATSPVNRFHSKGRGRYAKGWTMKNEGTTTAPAFIIHNKTDYQLTHLLEHGHPRYNGGRSMGWAEAYPHIADAEQFAIDYFTTKVEEGLKK